MGDWTDTKITDYSHKDLPWKVTESGKTVNYDLAFYREILYSVRVYLESENDDYLHLTLSQKRKGKRRQAEDFGEL
jgi:hypothetical protein